MSFRAAQVGDVFSFEYPNEPQFNKVLMVVQALGDEPEDLVFFDDGTHSKQKHLEGVRRAFQTGTGAAFPSEPLNDDGSQPWTYRHEDADGIVHRILESGNDGPDHGPRCMRACAETRFESTVEKPARTDKPLSCVRCLASPLGMPQVRVDASGLMLDALKR